MIGFTFNDIHSSTYNLVSLSTDRSLLPPLIKREISVPGRHGIYDFENNTHDKRIITIDISYIGSSIQSLRQQFRQIAAWLSKQIYCKLFFDDEPNIYYLAKIYNATGLESIKRFGKAQIQFECQPYALFCITSGQDVEWGDELIWGDDVAWDNAANHTVEVTGNTTFDIEYFGTSNVGAGSQSGSKFDIVIDGSFTTITIEINSKSITYSEAISSETVTIDNINMTVKKGTTNKLSVCSGDLIDFLHLENGTNTVTISGTGLNCDILFDFRPEYI